MARAEPEGSDPFWVLAKHADVKEVGSQPEAFPSNGYRAVARVYESRGQTIRKGDWVVLSNLFANRDKEVFENTDMFSLDRSRNINLCFRRGIYLCLGLKSC